MHEQANKTWQTSAQGRDVEMEVDRHVLVEGIIRLIEENETKEVEGKSKQMSYYGVKWQ